MAKKYKITSLPKAQSGLVQENIQQPSYWNDMTSSQSNGEQCPPGKYFYNGECLTEQEYVAASQKEMEDWQEKYVAQPGQKFEKQITELQQQNNEYFNKQFENKINEYYSKFKNSKKSDKIKPFETIPLSNLTKEAEESLKQQYLINKNDKGYAELYPLDVVEKRIIDNGFQADQFKNYWGLDPKQVEGQLGDLMKASKSQYEETMKQKILQKALYEEKPVSEVVKSLPKSLATKEGAQSFVAPTQKLIDDAITDFKKNITKSSLTNVDQLNKDYNVFFSEDPQKAWESKYKSNDIKYISDKQRRGQKAYNEWMEKYGSVGQYDNLTFADKSDRMADIRSQTKLANQARTKKDANQAYDTASNADYYKALSEYIGNFTSGTQAQVIGEALDNLNETQKLKFLSELEKYPDVAIQNLLDTKISKDKNLTYKDELSDRTQGLIQSELNRGTIKATPFKQNENTNLSKFLDVASHPFDAIYYGMNPREQMWGDSNLSYRNRLDLEKKHGIDLGTMPTNVMSIGNWTPLQAFNPFKIGTNLNRAYNNGNFTEALGKELAEMGVTRGFAKGLNRMAQGVPGTKQLIGSTFNNPLTDAGFLLQSKENFDKAEQAYDQGNYAEAIKEFGIGALNTAPVINTLRTKPFTFNTIPSNLKNQKLLGYDKGGVILKLSKKEIDQYIKDGYIVEEE